MFFVGSASQTRRIANVADGVNSTDAVSMGQLMSIIGAVAATYTVSAPQIQSVAKQAMGATASASLFAADGGATETADATGTHAVAAGANALASSTQSTALGANANAPASNSVALGAHSTADRDNTVSVCTVGSERQITNVAPGTQGTDAVNLNQLNGAMASSVAQSERYTDRGVAAALRFRRFPCWRAVSAGSVLPWADMAAHRHRASRRRIRQPRT
jgi:trimeric autotransporter adhesin